MIGLLIDSHCHLDNPVFDKDRSLVLERAQNSGVTACVLPATHAAGWENLQKIALEHDNLYPLYGLHPMFLEDHHEQDIDRLRHWLETCADAAGVGECGLDRYNSSADTNTLSLQMRYFQAQLEIARDTKLPIVIHARGAVEPVTNAVRAARNNLGMVHSYNGSYEQAKRLIDLGFMLSFGGAITYTRAHKLRKLVSRLPLDALLLETDSPDQVDAQHSGQRNEPAFLRDVFNTVCDLREEPPDVLAQAMLDNTIKLFNLPLDVPVIR